MYAVQSEEGFFFERFADNGLFCFARLTDMTADAKKGPMEEMGKVLESVQKMCPHIKFHLSQQTGKRRSGR